MGKPDVIDEKVSLDIKTVNNIEEKKDLDVYFFLYFLFCIYQNEIHYYNFEKIC